MSFAHHQHPSTLGGNSTQYFHPSEEYNDLKSDIIGKLQLVETSAKETLTNGKCKSAHFFLNIHY